MIDTKKVIRAVKAVRALTPDELEFMRVTLDIVNEKIPQAVAKKARRRIKGTQRPWTKEEDDNLRQLVKDGWSTKRIAKHTKRTLPAVWTRISAKNMRRKR